MTTPYCSRCAMTKFLLLVALTAGMVPAAATFGMMTTHSTGRRLATTTTTTTHRQFGTVTGVQRQRETRKTPMKHFHPVLSSRSSTHFTTSSSSSPSSSDHYPVYNYIVDIPISKRQRVELKWKHRPGQIELLSDKDAQPKSKANNAIELQGLTIKAKVDDDEIDPTSTSTSSSAHTMLRKAIQNAQDSSDQPNHPQQKKVVIIGMGPAGLFCALQLALFSNGQIKPILLDRGQPVEIRGRDIGALIHRLNLNKESNFCFGEGGAGTWSDGKLTTRIGRNSNAVRWVLELLVEFGAPPEILWQGAPHLGTDNLVRLLRNMRQSLFDLGGEIHFGTKMTDLEFDDSTGQVKAILAEEEKTVSKTDQKDGHDEEIPIQKHRFEADAFVLATGHSARDVYESLHGSGVTLEAKGFALGFRVEHPQALINQIQLGHEWGPCVTTGKNPTDKANEEFFGSVGEHPGKMPPPSYRLATDQADDGTGGDRHHRGVYSFCMCPGGQIVPASTEPDEICVNGMSFSRRDSVWANSALVVSVAPDDVVLKDYTERYGVMAGIEFQRDMERRAARLGGGNFTVPVQRLTDFVEGKVSETIPTSSYRLGVKSAPCHEIYPEPITTALRDALQNHFAHQMPSYYSKEGLLHAVETRTSSPLRVSRDPLTYTAVGTSNLFPAGEGAGFAGGIVSAAVDGLHVAEALLDLYVGNDHETVLEKSKSKGIGYSY
mmetsp:Transcript_53008/g.128599  ORF Transcript_53008/g.128599 Transcript_53008/m.128599 type:complete len:717 (+) Transcript_53008:72-2222(+)